MRVLRAAIVLALLFLTGCVWPFESDDYQDRLASVGTVSAPDTVDVGSAFNVEVISSGTNGCWRKGRDVVKQGDLQATIIPYDQEYVGSGGCTDNTPNFNHVANLQATTRGTFEVKVVILLIATTGKDSAGVIQRAVVVR